LASAYVKQESYEKAISSYFEILQFEPPQAAVNCYIGECFERLDKFEEAELHYKRALELDDQFCDAYVGLGVVADLKENYGTGLRYFEQALRLEPDNTDIMVLMAASLKKMELYKEADAVYVKMEAEAKGLFEILTKQAEGYKDVVSAAGGDPSKAFQLLLIEKLPELVRTQVDAVKNIKIDKITVWDSNGGSENGNSSTANFVSGMMKTVPPLNDLFNMAGLNLPTYLKGADVENESKLEVVP